MNPRIGLLLAILLPFVACGVQWLLWDAYIKPYVWFLFFPAAFFSARLGGLPGGLAGTLVGALLVWYVYIPPQFSWELQSGASVASIILFITMGSLFAWFFERLQQVIYRSNEARLLAEQAKEEITRLYQKTLELDELKSQFFANVSHELRTPLTLIMAPLARRLDTTDMCSADRAEAEMMLRNVRLLYRHVSDLLDAAKLEAGAMNAEYTQLDLVELTRAMVSNFDSIARERGISYGINVPAVLPVEADSEKVQRILLNLLSNAFKFTPDGGRIEVRLYESDEKAVIEVQDNGPGVPVEMRDAVFERFRQLEGASNRRYGGTGLGLAIAREFAHLHGGNAEVSEAPGGGALFSVRLPLKAPTDASVATTQHQLNAVIANQAVEDLVARPASANTVTISDIQDAPLVLVVEDNIDMNAFIADILRQHYRVASAFNGLAGLEKAQSLAPDLILADVMMPEMSGDEMVLELRRKPEMADVPIVMLTAKADDDLRIKLLQAGIQDYLTKPFKVEELLARVGGLLDERRRAGSQLREIENRFEATFEQAAVGIALVAPDGHWLRVNHKLCDIIGYTPDELLTKTFQNITFPDDLDSDLEFVRQMLAKQIDSYSMEKRYSRKDGSIVWVNLSVALTRKPDGSPDYFISVIEDISRRKKAEAQLKLWGDAFAKAEFGLAIGNPQTQKILSVNPAFARRRGYSPEELIGKPVTLLFPTDCMEHARELLLDSDRQGHGNFETEHLCKNGERFPVLLDITTTKSVDDKPINRIVYAIDISERKQAERALQHQTEELKRRNEELERFNSASVDRELEMIRLKQQVNDLARQLGHELPYDLSFVNETDAQPGGAP